MSYSGQPAILPWILSTGINMDFVYWIWGFCLGVCPRVLFAGINMSSNRVVIGKCESGYFQNTI